MRKAALILIVVLFVPVARAADGAVVAQEPCAPIPTTTYEAYLENAKARDAEEAEAAKREGHRQIAPPPYLTRAVYEKRKTQVAAIDCSRVRYMSDGLQVVAFIWKPKDIGSKKLPLMIFNRGGNREFAKLSPSTWASRFTLDGFVVVASQYRGTDGGEGKEEFGGADVHDVMNLIPLAQSLGYVDMKNVFVLGWSRGGMMTALALKQGMKVNAAAVGGALTDLAAEKARRPALAARVWSELMPGYAERTDDVLRERSAVNFADRIDVPLLILQGGADWRVDAADSLSFAQALQKAGATYELIVYAGDDHSISVNKEDSNRRIVEWFRRYMTK